MKTIYDYIDYREHLKDFYLSKKLSDRHFSYTAWANLAGINGRSYIRMVISGKRNLTEITLEKLISTLDLNEREQDYFRALVKFTQAKTMDSRDLYFKELSAKKRGKPLSVVQAKYELLSSPLVPKLQTVLGLKNISKTVKDLALILDVEESEIKKYLQILTQLDLAEEVHNEWQSKTNGLYIPTNFGNQGLKKFYKDSFKDLAESVELPKEDRYFGSVFLSLCEKSKESVLAEIDHFLDGLTEKYRSHNLTQGNLFQLTIGNKRVSNNFIQSQGSVSKVKQ